MQRALFLVRSLLVGVFVLALPEIGHAAQEVFAAEITSVSPSTFTAGQSATVTVQIRSTSGSGNVVLEASWTSGWSVSPKDRNPTINQGTYYTQTFTVTPPSSGGNGTIVWILYDDDWGVHPVGSTWLATKSQSVSANVPKPDLDVTQVVDTLSSYNVGSKINAKVTIKNVGEASAGSSKLYYYLGSTSGSESTGPSTQYKAIQQGSISSLSVDQSATDIIGNWITGGWTIPPDVSTGTYRIWVKADSSNQVAESDENNNWGCSASFTITAPMPDFSITSISLTPQSPQEGSSFSATVSVKNVGEASGNAGYLDVWANKSSSQSCGADGDQYTSVGTLTPGQTKSFTFSGLPAGTAGSKTFRAYVDSACSTSESAESNNQLTLSYSVTSVPRTLTVSIAEGEGFLRVNGVLLQSELERAAV